MNDVCRFTLYVKERIYSLMELLKQGDSGKKSIFKEIILKIYL